MSTVQQPREETRSSQAVAISLEPDSYGLPIQGMAAIGKSDNRAEVVTGRGGNGQRGGNRQRQ